MLRLRSVSQFYGDRQVLWNVDLELPHGSATGIIGQPGMGKTTLANCIMGHLPIGGGSMVWQQRGARAEDLQAQPAEARARLGISYLPQGCQLFSQLSVEENLLIALLAGQQAGHPVLPTLVSHLFPALWQRRHLRSGALPLALQQQLMLARALAPQPDLLIVDEPTAGMPSAQAEETGERLHQLNQEYGLTLLLIARHTAVIRRTANAFLLLHHGRNVAQGHVAELDSGAVDEWLAPG
ncbi:High-affinity branched-chain amino acid transport ATP-binding protein LivF [Mixta theicola]|nr:ATP-binding cassette domain-containing protein [Mixta theicola]QHM76164.1 High-affinity branched-chain amino acid transport ATP-binding protein LivF [Mixta theicola]